MQRSSSPSSTRAPLQDLPPQCNYHQVGFSPYCPFGCFEASVALGEDVESLEGVELDEVSLDGVALDDEDDDGVLVEDDGLALEPLVDESLLLELELGVLLELGGVALLELELLGLVVLGLALMDPELEPLLEDGLVGVDLLPMVVELELDDGEVASREAPVLEPGPLLQPYRPPTATAIGRTTSAVFFRMLMDGAPIDSEGGLRRNDRCKEWTCAGLYKDHFVYG